MSKKPPNWSKIGKRSRAKGAAFEREAKKVCAGLWDQDHCQVDWTRIRPETAQRLGAGDLAPTYSEIATAGIPGRPVLNFGWVIECKHRRQINAVTIQGWIDKMLVENPDRVPVLIYRVDNGPVTVVCPSSLGLPLPWKVTWRQLKVLQRNMASAFFLPSWTWRP